jgi:hypothetical protein
MKRIKLHGKYATGAHTFALVDDDTFEALNVYRWKAKPNGAGNHIYAVRNTLEGSGKWKMIRMHRVVLGYDGPLDVDHVNRNALDNRRENLRIATRRENLLNRGEWQVVPACLACGATFPPRTARVSAPPLMVCAPCRKKARVAAAPTPKTLTCEHCAAPFASHMGQARFCGEPCRKKAKRLRQQAAGTIPPSKTPALNRARAHAWRQRHALG